MSPDLPTASEATGVDRALKTRAVRGAVLTFAQQGGSQLLRLAANLAVTRLVDPEAYGMTSLVTVLTMGLVMFSDIGISPLVIRSARGDERKFLDTMWTIQLVRGVGIWLVASAAAVPFAAFYESPLLAQVIPVAALVSIIDAFAPTKQYTAQRHMQFGRLTLIDLLAQVLGLAVQVGLALVWPTVWALIIGMLANAVAATLLMWVMLPGPGNRLCWEREARAELVGFGRWLFLSTALTFASQSMDRLIFGRVLTLDQLGVYSNGKMMASAPSEAMGRIGSGVVYPFYSKVVNAGQALAPVFVRARWPLLVLSGWGLSLLAALGQPLIDFMYDDRYRSAGWVVQVLALGGWFNVLWTTNVYALLSLGQSKWMAATTGVKTVATLVLIPIGAKLGGFQGAVIGFAAADVVQLCVSAMAVASNRLAPIWQDVPISLLVLLAAGAGFWASRFGHSNITAMLIAGAVVSAFWAPLAYPLLRAFARGQNPLRSAEQ